MKKITVSIILVISIILAIILATDGAPKNIERATVNDVEINANNNTNGEKETYDVTKLNFEFEGFAPGKSHVGTFKEIYVKNFVEGEFNEGSVIAFKLSSVETNIEKLNTDLCKEMFFDCEKYDEATFQLTEVNEVSENKYEAKGILSLKGNTKEIVFPVTKDGERYSADFVLDTKPFGIDVPFANNEVQIRVNATK